jgi:hypothetical protein
MKRTRLLTLVVAMTIGSGPVIGAPASGLESLGPEAPQGNPIATDETTYQQYARVFSDPQGCLLNGPLGAGPETGQTPVSPWAKGRACTVDYLSYDETIEGAKFLAKRFPDLVQIVRLDQDYGNADFKSAGIGRAVTVEDGTLRPYGRDRSPLYMFKVTDVNSDIPESERLHFVYGLSIHGAEPAGREAGPRAMEDLVTWAACEMNDDRAESTPACETEGPFPKPIIESDTDRPVPTAGEVVRETVNWFTINNPDGHRMGQRRPAELRDGNPNVNFLPGLTTLRGNGHGVDLNRDWPAMGYTLKSHQTGSEPETRGFVKALEDIRDNTSGKAFAGGIDLHGMDSASAFSYTLLGADQRDFRKNQITVETSLRTWEDQTERLCWSPHIGDRDCDGEQDTTAQIPVADQWGTVYDTLGYTITGGYGFWMDDSTIGLGGVGINNEMALRTDNHQATLNQTWIDGNKGLIYSLISALMFEEEARFEPTGRVGYVFNPNRLTEEGRDRPSNPGLPAQNDIDVFLPCQGNALQQLPGNCGPGQFSVSGTTAAYEFDVHGPDRFVWNGGMTVRSTTPRHSTPSYQTAGVTIQRLNEDTGEWDTMKTLQRTSTTYNDPEPGRWRVTFSATGAFPRRLEVQFDRSFAEMSPGQRPIDVSTMDFFTELNEYVPEGSRLEAVAIADVLKNPAELEALDTLVVTNELGVAGYLTEELGLSSDEAEAYFGALKGFTEGGGNLLLLDAGLNALHEFGLVEPEDVRELNGLAGFYAFRTASGLITYEDPETYPLARGVDVPGAAERTTGSRQAVEPTPIGYSPDGHSAARMPFWGVARPAWEELCDQAEPTHCTTATTSAQGSVANLGEIALGDGTIRIAGALLPDPMRQEDNVSDNRFGLTSYAITYTAYEVLENLLDYRRP